QAAARSILGHEEPFTDPPFFWSRHYDVSIRVTGFLGGWDEEVVVGDPDQGRVLVGFRAGDHIRAVATIGRDLDNLRAEDALTRDDEAALEALLHVSGSVTVGPRHHRPMASPRRRSGCSIWSSRSNPRSIRRRRRRRYTTCSSLWDTTRRATISATRRAGWRRRSPRC